MPSGGGGDAASFVGNAPRLLHVFDEREVHDDVNKALGRNDHLQGFERDLLSCSSIKGRNKDRSAQLGRPKRILHCEPKSSVHRISRNLPSLPQYLQQSAAVSLATLVV